MVEGSAVGVSGVDSGMVEVGCLSCSLLVELLTGVEARRVVDVVFDDEGIDELLCRLLAG